MILLYQPISRFNTASGMRSRVTDYTWAISSSFISFNTASGMRSRVTRRLVRSCTWTSQGFNTASGMRSRVTLMMMMMGLVLILFQYRKRYEVTCDFVGETDSTMFSSFNTASGMRSRVTIMWNLISTVFVVSIPQAV